MTNYLKSIYNWLKAKAQDMRALLRQQVPAAYEKAQGFRRGAQEQVKWFCTSPLGKAEYAMLKRVSAIVGTALALYLVVTSGFMQVIMVTGLCVGLAWLLHRGPSDISPGRSGCRFRYPPSLTR